ncbi:MAG: hypothetical protein IJ681_04465 [Bacteroidales bacterium]|nr:hypothetical protein [Bacteroidales bacterium]
MKKNILKTFVAVLFFSVMIPCFSSCSDDLDGCGLTVVVIDGQTNERISGAAVHVGISAGTITADDYSNDHGEAKFFFKNEAIFDVTVKSGEAPYIKNGSARVRLKDGKVVLKKIPLY